MGPSGAVGRITSGIEPNALVRKTLAFVHEQLPAWRDDPHRTQEEAEDKLNEQLSMFLERGARTALPMVCFHHQTRQTGRRKVDLSALPQDSTWVEGQFHTHYQPFLVIEGKRLPAPSANREKEYLTGGHVEQSGGVQRFKLGLHGAGLPAASMVGYVQKESLASWFGKINEWIGGLARGNPKDLCSWSAKEVLRDFVEDSAQRVAACLSDHPRNEEAPIVLHHFWVVMNVRQPQP